MDCCCHRVMMPELLWLSILVSLSVLNLLNKKLWRDTVLIYKSSTNAKIFMMQNTREGR